VATFYDHITEEQAALIRKAPVFFVATADPALQNSPDGAGAVNVSPKGDLPLTILAPDRVAYLDYPGSGNETARHSAEGGPITVMVCSYDEDAAIVRLFGHATVTPVEDAPIADQLTSSLESQPTDPLRQIIDITIDRTMTSCGYGVPVMSFIRNRRKDDRGRVYKAAKDAPPVKV